MVRGGVLFHVPPWNAGTPETPGTGGTPETHGTQFLTSQNGKTV